MSDGFNWEKERDTKGRNVNKKWVVNLVMCLPTGKLISNTKVYVRNIIKAREKKKTFYSSNEGRGSNLLRTDGSKE